MTEKEIRRMRVLARMQIVSGLDREGRAELAKLAIKAATHGCKAVKFEVE